MTLLQTLAILWARWFCKHWYNKDICALLIESVVPFDEESNNCPGIKCEGCPL